MSSDAGGKWRPLRLDTVCFSGSSYPTNSVRGEHISLDTVVSATTYPFLYPSFTIIACEVGTTAVAKQGVFTLVTISSSEIRF